MCTLPLSSDMDSVCICNPSALNNTLATILMYGCEFFSSADQEASRLCHSQTW